MSGRGSPHVRPWWCRATAWEVGLSRARAPVHIPLAYSGAAPDRCRSACRSSPTGSAMIGSGVRPPNRSCQVMSGVAFHQLAEPPGPFALPGRWHGNDAVPLHFGVARVRRLNDDPRPGAPAVLQGDAAAGPVGDMGGDTVSAEPGSADSSSAAVARALRLRSESACSRNGSSAGDRPSRSESRNVAGPRPALRPSRTAVVPVRSAGRGRAHRRPHTPGLGHLDRQLRLPAQSPGLPESADAGAGPGRLSPACDSAPHLKEGGFPPEGGGPARTDPLRDERKTPQTREAIPPPAEAGGPLARRLMASSRSRCSSPR